MKSQLQLSYQTTKVVLSDNLSRLVRQLELAFHKPIPKVRFYFIITACGKLFFHPGQKYIFSMLNACKPPFPHSTFVASIS